MDEELDPHIEDILKALGHKVDKVKVAEELKNYLEVYRVGVEDAKRSIVKKFGGTAARFEAGVDKKLSELQGTESNVNLLCRIVSLNRKEIDSNGSKKEIFYGILGDETGTVPFTAWETENLGIDRGDVIKVENAYAKEWMGKVQVYFGTRVKISQESKDLLPYPKKALSKVGELEEGMRNVSVAARILFVEKREVDVSGEKKEVFSGVIGDESGKIRFSAWSDFQLMEDEVIKIEGAYVKSWRGILQLNFDDRADVQRIGEHFPSKEDISMGAKLFIDDIEGGVDLLVEGVILDVKDGSGLIYRCPECNRAVKRGACNIHGDVEAVPDLRIKAVLDDSTGAMTVVLGKKLTEMLLNKNLQKCLEETRSSPNPELIKDELYQKLISRPMRLRGNVLKDDFGLMMIVDSADFLKIDLRERAEALLNDIGI